MVAFTIPPSRAAARLNSGVMLQNQLWEVAVDESQQPSDSAISTVARTAMNIIDGASLPAPVRKNALKAFDQLCSALVDIPVAYLEGFAQSKRAENTARAEIIRQSGDQIAAGIEVDPEFARAAATKYAQKIIRERRSLDQISSIAAAQLENISDTAQTENAQEINDDWINNFENEASQKSSSEMQELFGSILAGEISKPGSFSIRAVKILGQLDTPVAKLFQKLCSTAIALQLPGYTLDARVASLGGNAASNSLSKYGLSFDNLNTLQEYGLVISDFNSWMGYSFSIVKDNHLAIGFTHAGGVYGLVRKDGGQSSAELKIHGVALTKAARELMKVVPIVPDETYTSDLATYFDGLGFSMTPVRAAAT